MLDIAYVIFSEPVYKCSCCGNTIGSCTPDGNYNPPEWQDWNFCPYCGYPLHDD